MKRSGFLGCLSGFIERKYVRMIQTADDTRLALKAPQPGRINGQPPAQDFDRSFAA
jgi:hypothetical protein